MSRSNILVIKLNATGDVVRTTALLRRLPGAITWITAPKNVVLLDGLIAGLRCFSWEERVKACDLNYDLVINLEDEADVAAFAATVKHRQVFGAYSAEGEKVAYTDDSRDWFDMSLISVHGRKQADRLKFLNRSSYQEMLFDGLGLQFEGERYLLPLPSPTDLSGDVAIAPMAGPVWPMKNWAYYDELKTWLEANGLRVNFLPRRVSLLEHLGDVKNHRCLVGGDSLPMHMALGLGVPCVSLFTCTSPWEIHGYGIQTKLVSPLLEEFFYRRGMDLRATTAIAVAGVLEAVMERLSVPSLSVGDDTQS